jgi:hypothetical protein
MSSLQQDLDAIAARQGKSIAPGSVIQGDGGSWPTSPSFEPGDRPVVSREFADDLDDEGFEPSPLIPKPQPMGPMTPTPEPYRHPAPTPENLPNFQPPDLLVVGMDADKYVASYQGRTVDLSAVEAATVRKVVLQAIKRTIMLQLHDVEALLPRRKRNQIPVLKRRGRPKKVAP